MKEQILVFFSNFMGSHDGLIVDITCNGEVEIDVVDHGMTFISELMLEFPEKDSYGFWLWEGAVGYDKEIGEVDYLGQWRRLSLEEIIKVNSGERFIINLNQPKKATN